MYVHINIFNDSKQEKKKKIKQIKINNNYIAVYRKWI